jgi:hypothetical protein
MEHALRISGNVFGASILAQGAWYPANERQARTSKDKVHDTSATYC